MAVLERRASEVDGCLPRFEFGAVRKEHGWIQAFERLSKTTNEHYGVGGMMSRKNPAALEAGRATEATPLLTVGF